jgi:ribosomal protein S12 methylthiotransferase accessory factor YcaO
MLEAAELACAEGLPLPPRKMPLQGLAEAVRRCWAGQRSALAIDLDPTLARGWVEGRLLGSGLPMPMPWDLLSLDFTRPVLEFPAVSAGLATGNTREEALLTALCELVEHDAMARFEQMRPRDRRALQIDAGSIADAGLLRDLGRVSSLGFMPRLWSVGQHHGIAAIACVLFAAEPMLDRMTPSAGTACHPEAATAARAALREAVQGRAALVAGARDDIVPEHYIDGRDRTFALAMATLALEDGPLAWTSVPTTDCGSMQHGVRLLEEVIGRLTPLPVVLFDHPHPVPGLHVVHALAPGLLHRSRRRRARRTEAPRRVASQTNTAPPARGRAVLFAGPSIAGLAMPPELVLRPPAICGDLAALIADPPGAVGLVDGHFGIAPSVWHKEILDLLARGVRVLGAASLGAIRAAELADAGMEGVGTIYAAYRSGAIERDDAVMLLQAPADYDFAPLTLPLVDAEHALHGIECGPRERRMMQRIVRTMPYEIRTWPRCLDAYRERTGAHFPVSLKALSRAPSLKQHDAALLVAQLSHAARNPRVRPACEPPPLTTHYLKLLARSLRGDA